MIAVEYRGITKSYAHKQVLRDVSLSVESGSLTVIYGLPACGKSVLVRLLTGLEKPDSGRIFIREADVTDEPPGKRNIGYVPQSFALYPHYSVYDNIAYPLQLMHVPRKEIEPVVQQAAQLLKIERLLKKRPDQLSGGEKQRVAIARGIVKRTDIYVLDDPLTGLDFKLREQLFDDLKQMQESLQATFLYTTSDPLETLMLAERVEVIDAGMIIDSGQLAQVYAHPRHVRSMELLDFPRANLLAGVLHQSHDKVWCDTGTFKFPIQLDHLNGTPVEGKAVRVGVRSQHLWLDSEKTNGYPACPAQIILQEDLGGELLIHLQVQDTAMLAVVRHDEAHLLREDEVTVGVHPTSFILFGAADGLKIGQGTEK
jgi:ABC-type sugar transport system ATPase subunit